MLEEVVTIDKIEVVEFGVIQVRQSTKILKDGVQIGSDVYHRWTLTPGQDVSDQDQRVQAVCTAVWTPEVIAAYLARGQT